MPFCFRQVSLIFARPSLPWFKRLKAGMTGPPACPGLPSSRSAWQGGPFLFTSQS
ncbi:hypothetical protein L345_00142, partial [Ophiophagus hannah]